MLTITYYNNISIHKHTLTYAELLQGKTGNRKPEM